MVEGSAAQATVATGVTLQPLLPNGPRPLRSQPIFFEVHQMGHRLSRTAPAAANISCVGLWVFVCVCACLCGPVWVYTCVQTWPEQKSSQRTCGPCPPRAAWPGSQQGLHTRRATRRRAAASPGGPGCPRGSSAAGGEGACRRIS